MTARVRIAYRDRDQLRFAVGEHLTRTTALTFDGAGAAVEMVTWIDANGRHRLVPADDILRVEPAEEPPAPWPPPTPPAA